MKTIRSIASLFIVATLAGCSGTGGNGNITGTFLGAEGNTAYFQRFDKGVAVNVDSAIVADDGTASFNAPGLKLDFYQLDFGGNRKMLLILDEGDTPSISVNVNDIYTAEINGSDGTAKYYEYMARMKDFELEKQRFRDELRNDQGNAALTEQYNQVNSEQYEYMTGLIDDNPGSPLALTILGSLNAEQEVERYKRVRDEMSQTMPHSGFFTQLSQNVELIEKQAELRAKQQQQQLISASALAVGNEAPDFAQQTPDGEVLKLSDLRGKVVLIDFWASWCKPCRRENPNVVKAYNKYKDKGFEILGVSLDRDRSRWLQAIEQDGLTWPQVSDLGFWQNAVAQQYGVSSIPFTVLVDREGKVLATRLRGPALERKLEELLGA